MFLLEVVDKFMECLNMLFIILDKRVCDEVICCVELKEIEDVLEYLFSKGYELLGIYVFVLGNVIVYSEN